MNLRLLTRSAIALALVGAALPFARADIKLGQERFAGRGSRGPYALALQGVDDRSEQVWVNGARMIKGQDYLFDATMGALSFTDSVPQSASIEVSYQYDTAKAHAPGPLGGTLGLLNGGSGGLAITYAFKPSGNGNQTLANLGFSGQGSMLGSSFTSSFMVDKTAGANAGAAAQNMLMSMKRDSGPFQFSLDYSNVGKQFSQADALKLIKGSEALNFNGTLQLAQNSAITLKDVKNATPDAKTGVVKETSDQLGGVGLNLGASTKLTALHEVQSEAAGKDTKRSAVDRLQLDQNLGNGASATLVNETVTNGKNGQDETVKATRMNLTAIAGSGLKLETNLAQTDSSKSGAARDAGVKLSGGDGNTKIAMSVSDRRADSGDVLAHALSLESAQAHGLHFAAGLSGEKTGAGTHSKTSLAMDGGTSDRLKFGVAMSNDSGAGKHGTATKLSLSSVLANGLKFSATQANDDTVANGAFSSRMNLEASPSQNLKLVASRAADKNEKGETETTKVNVAANSGDIKVAMNFAGDSTGTVSKEASGVNIEANPNNELKLTAAVGAVTDDKGNGQSKAVGIEATPNGALHVALSHTDSSNDTGQSGANKFAISAGSKANNLTGSYSDALSPTGPSSIKQASVNLVPVKNHMTLTGSYSDETKQDKSEVQIAMLQADVKPIDAFAVHGYYKQRDTGTADPINTVDATVTLKPANAVQMVGTYTQNPEEKDQVIRLVRRGLALQTQMGGLSLSGGYIQENSLLDTSQGTRAEFKLGLQCSKNSKLQGGFQQTIGSVRGYKPQFAYNLTYNHDMGSDFHLLLDANVTKLDDTVPVPQREDVKATANLAVRF